MIPQRFGVVNPRVIYDTIASNYSEIGLSHTLQRSELKRPRDTGGRLFFDASQSRFNRTQPSDMRINPDCSQKMTTVG